MNTVVMQRGRNRWIIGIGIVIVIALIFFATTFYSGSDECDVAYIPLHGEMLTYGGDSASSSDVYEVSASEDVTQSIRSAAGDPSIRAIVLEVDSPGGDPVAGEEVETALKNAGKPTVALIRSQGDSAAYMAATGANTIFASDFSEVGDIGITESYTDVAQQDAESGITFNQLSVGKYKDMFDPDKPMTADERALAMKQLQSLYQDFIQIVATNRGLSVSTTTALANGASLTGEEALSDGLIDRIGNVDDVRSFLSQKLGHDAVICGIDD